MAEALVLSGYSKDGEELRDHYITLPNNKLKMVLSMLKTTPDLFIGDFPVPDNEVKEILDSQGIKLQGEINEYKWFVGIEQEAY